MTKLFLLISFILFACHGFTQQYDAKSDSSRAKVGLVLSGGGAKGMAHVGALKVLEEVGIVPDYITGTSMGSLVGALYAIGYSAAEMDAILKGISWDQLLSDKVSLHEITIEEKPYYGRYLIELPMNGLSVGLPRGALNGQKLSELFSKLTLSVHNIDKFSNFPIPFAAMAVDLPSGTNVLLDRGSLPEAMRSSMAIPTIFTPVSRDDTLLLVDGGLARNFPVQEVLDMGADIVIGINVAGGFSNVDDIRTLADVLVESSFLYSNLNTLEDKRNVDVLIEPDLSGYSTGSFDDVDSIIDLGYVAALKQKMQLKMLADTVYGLSYRPALPEKLAEKDSFYIRHISVVGNDKVPSSYIKGKLNLQNDIYLKVDQIERNIELLYGTRFFNKITYEIRNFNELIPYGVPAGSEHSEQLIIHVEEAPDAYFRPALHYDTENGAGFILSYVHRNLLLPSSRLTLEADFAENPRVFFNYYKYLGRKQRFAAILGVDYILNDIPSDFGAISNRASIIFRSSWLNPYFRLQTSQFQNWMLGINLGWETARLKPAISSGIFENVKRFYYNSLQFGAYAQLNSLDEPVFPNKGWYINAKIEQVSGVKMTSSFYDSLSFEDELIDLILGSFTNTGRASLEMHHYLPLSKRWNLQSELLMTYISKDTLLSPYDEYQMGGFNPILKNSYAFWGNKPYEITSKSALMWRESARFEMIPNLFAEAVVNILLRDEDQYSETSDFESVILGYGLGLQYRSILGPIQFRLAHRHNTNRIYGYFSLGFNISK